MADGTITVDTEIDTSGFERGGRNLTQEEMRLVNRLNSLRRAFQQVNQEMREMEEVRVDPRLEEQQLRLQNRITDTTSRIAELEQRLAEMREVHIDTAAVERLTARIQDTEQQMLSLLDQRERLEEQTTANLPQASPEQIQAVLRQTDEWNQLTDEIDTAGASLERYEAELERVRTSGQDRTDTEEYRNAERQLNSLRNNLELYQTQMRNMPAIEHDQTDTRAYANAARRAEDLADSIRLVERQLEDTRQAGERVVRTTRNIGNEGERNFKRAGSACGGFKGRLMSIVAGAFVFNIISEGLRQLTQYMGKMLKSNNQFSQSLAEIKGNLLTAFQPIYEAVLPAINALMRGLSIASAYLAKFTSAIFGKSVKVSQKNAEALYTQANALDSVADSAKAADKRLSGIDELQVINKKDEGSSGGEEKQSDTVAPDFTTDIEGLSTAPLENFINYLKKNALPVFSEAFGGMGEQVGKFKGTCKGIFRDLCTLADPFKEYLNNDFLPFLDTVVFVSGDILTGLSDTFNMVFADLWNNAVFPFVNNLVTVGLPTVTEFATQMWILGRNIFSVWKECWDKVWSEGVSPALSLITEMWTEFVNTLSEFWNKWGQPIFDGINEAVKKTGDIFLTIWDTILKPVWDNIMIVIDEVWTKHMQPLVANLLDFVGEFVTAALDIYNNFIAPLVQFLSKVLGPIFVKVFNLISNKVGTVIGTILDVANGLITSLKGVVQFLKGVFTGDVDMALKGIKNIFKGIFDSLVAIVKTPVNKIIDVLNGMISGVVSGINTVIKAVNSLSFEVPDWVPGIGGEEFGFDLKKVTAPRIPKLATGAVIPPNKEFLAVLGDQKNGTNIEAPADLIKQKVVEGLKETGSGMEDDTEVHVHLYLEGDADGIFKIVKTKNEKIKKQTGKSAFA